MGDHEQFNSAMDSQRRALTRLERAAEGHRQLLNLFDAWAKSSESETRATFGVRPNGHGVQFFAQRFNEEKRRWEDARADICAGVLAEAIERLMKGILNTAIDLSKERVRNCRKEVNDSYVSLIEQASSLPSAPGEGGR